MKIDEDKKIIDICAPNLFNVSLTVLRLSWGHFDKNAWVVLEYTREDHLEKHVEKVMRRGYVNENMLCNRMV